MARSRAPGRSAVLGRRALIFVTIGTSLPFDRLIRAADELAAVLPEQEFFGQIGDGGYAPRNFPFVRMLNAQDYAEQIAATHLIVAHAGMGSLITAIDANKPVVIMPRRLAFDEINTDHQVATARRWVGRRGVHVAPDEKALGEAVRLALADASDGAGLCPTPGFIDMLRAYITTA